MRVNTRVILWNRGGGSGSAGTVNNATVALVCWGAVAPNGVVLAPKGSMYNQITGGVFVATFINVDGTINGWQ
jgi:hypothetical protein